MLKEEHRLIERAAACLDRIADGAIADRGFDAVAALGVLEFLEHFANEAHQRKEERLLFPALLQQGLQCARVGELLLEHRAEREALERLHAELEGAAYGDPLSGDRFAALAHDYASNQLEHAAKENQVLLPLAEKHLDSAREAELLAGARAIDAEYGLRGREHYERTLEFLAARLGALPAVPGAAATCAPQRELPLMLEICCELDRQGGEEALVTWVNGHLVRERPEELALEPAGA